MADTVVKVLDNGPLLVNGPIELVDAAGNKFETAAQFGLCRCGASANKPFCNGAHKTAGFADAARATK